MIEIGRVCYKIAGRDAGNIAIIVDKLDKNHVLIDGNVRRRKCNIMHLEPTKTILKIKNDAPTSEVKKAMEYQKLIIKEIEKVKRSPKKAKKDAKK